jgi:hypothetical protein
VQVVLVGLHGEILVLMDRILQQYLLIKLSEEEEAVAVAERLLQEEVEVLVEVLILMQ